MPPGGAWKRGERKAEAATSRRRHRMPQSPKKGNRGRSGRNLARVRCFGSVVGDRFGRNSISQDRMSSLPMKRYVISRRLPPLSRRDFVAGGLALGAAGAARLGHRSRRHGGCRAEIRPCHGGQAAAAASCAWPRSTRSFASARTPITSSAGWCYGFQKDGFHHQPNVQVVRMFNDQYADGRSEPAVSASGTASSCARPPAEALGEGGGLDVDAVALIIEHGDYPLNEFGQVLYPRYELFPGDRRGFRQERPQRAGVRR